MPALTETIHIDTYTNSKELPPLLEGSILHSTEMFRSIEKRRNSTPYMLVARDGEGKEVAHILIIRTIRFHILPLTFSCRYTINGEGAYSPECNREEIFSHFIDKITETFTSSYSVIEIQNIEDSRFAYGTLSKHGFTPFRDQRIYISLHSKAPQERLTRSYKAHIRKAESNGVTFRRATSNEEIQEALHLMRNYYMSKTRHRLPDSRALQEILHDTCGNLSEKAKLFIVSYKEKIIGSSICLYDKERANLAYSCGLRKSYPMQFPGIMAIWAAITDAHSNGYAHFEFLEARGLSTFHAKFINTLLNYGGKQKGTVRWYRFKWNWLNKILHAIYV